MLVTFNWLRTGGPSPAIQWNIIECRALVSEVKDVAGDAGRRGGCDEFCELTCD
ncbi:hypothetical protein E2C01_076810 [Portunus trituberculatus]|uniref:Uncharacterized protein n=1 Tax=Portunus trituberculatus TaxID=210409 RepID=A0A5B7IIL9_PORTR|nr:hypothetical protein [Portunus trituberculatus]